MDRLMELSEYMVRRIKQMSDKYYLILEPEMVNVCFWYLPTRVRNMPHTAERIKIIADVRFILNRCFILTCSYWWLHFGERWSYSANRNKEQIICSQICPILKGRMMQAGTLMVGYQPDDRRPNFFRNIISSAAVTEVDVDFLLAEMDRLGHDL